MYSIHFESNAIDDLKKLPKNARNLLRREIPKQLTLEPTVCSSALTGPLDGFYSYHIRQYRVVFMIVEMQVWIVGVGQHSRSAESGVYRRLEDLHRRGELARKFLSSLTRLKDLLR